MLDRNAYDQVVFDSGSVRVGAFRCDRSHPSFQNTGPIQNWCFVFPRTAVEIERDGERAYVSNPNNVNFYNKGQVYVRNAISAEGDRCDWFGVDLGIVQDVVGCFDSGLEARPERPFRFARRWSDAQTYLLQRRLFEQVSDGAVVDPLAVEEAVIALLERVVAAAYGVCVPRHSNYEGQNDVVHHLEQVLSEHWAEDITLADIAREAGMSLYHVCRMFRSATGTTLHQYRHELRLRWSLEGVIESRRPLVDIALDAGFSSHSHFTNSFRRQFAVTPSQVRLGGPDPISARF